MEVTTNNVPVKVESSNGSERPAKKNGKEEKSRRKDDKSMEQVMKALNVLETTEEKLAAMCKKYTEIVDENRKLQLSAKQWEKGLHSVLREKEQLQTDHSKAVLTRSRLESLCRELQRQNKQIKEESLLKIREEEEKRKEVSAKFNATLGEITALMTSSNEKTNMLRDENVEITKKFKSICDQNAIQQQQVDKMNTQRKLESELTEARLAKQRLEFVAEKEILLKEKQELYLDLHTLHARVKELEGSEISLKGQVALYADRYDEFQNALTKSNEVFGGFKGEMEKMSKKITRLEKETSTWKSRWEKSHQSFLEVVAEKSKCEGELALASRKHTQLEKLCRTLQTERVLLLAQIKGVGSLPTPGDGNAETTAHIESSSISANTSVDQTSTNNVEVTSEGVHESSKDLTAAIETLNLQSSNSDNQEKLHCNNPDVINIAQAPIDSMDVETAAKVPVDNASVEKSPVFPSGDSSNSQDDVSALTVASAPSSHVDGGSNCGDAASRASAEKPVAEKLGSKVSDTRAANKKGMKSRVGVKEMQADKKTKPPPPSGDVKKGSVDVSKEKKDNDNVRALIGNKGKSEVPGDKKDKKTDEVNDRKDESVKDKEEIDCSNAKQKRENIDGSDSNKLAELISEEKKNGSKVQEKNGHNVQTRNLDQENRVTEVPTNNIPLPSNANVEKIISPEKNLIQHSYAAVAAPIVEKKGPDPSGVSIPTLKGEVKKTGVEADEKQIGTTQVENLATKAAEAPTKESNSKKEVGTAFREVVGEKMSEVGKIECEVSSKQPLVSAKLERNKAIVDSPTGGKKIDCKLGGGVNANVSAGSTDVEKKVGVTLLDSSKREENESRKKDATKELNFGEKENMLSAIEAKVAPNVQEVEDGGWIDVKKIKKPEKPRKQQKPPATEEKIGNMPKSGKPTFTAEETFDKTPKPDNPPVVAEEKSAKTPTDPEKPSLPEHLAENKKTEDRSQTDPTPPAPNPTSVSESHAPPQIPPTTPETTALPPSPPTVQESEAGSPLKTHPGASEVNQGAKQQSDTKKEKVVAKKRKK